MVLLNDMINENFYTVLQKYAKYQRNKQNPKLSVKKRSCCSCGKTTTNEDAIQDIQILFTNSDNISVWYDIWSEIRKNSRDYFDEQKYYIITVFILLIFSIGLGVLRIFTNQWNDIINSYEDIHKLFFGAPVMLYTIISFFIFGILLYLSFQFPKIQKQQLRSLMDQHYYICNMTSQLTKKYDKLISMDYDKNTIDHIIQNLRETKDQIINVKKTKKSTKKYHTIYVDV